jgi:hypothetical protein
MSEIEIRLPFDLPLLPVERLTAGEISCFYERGNIRYISLAGEEVIRMIYPAVRSSTWATATYEIEEETKDIGENRFDISYTAIYRLDLIHYRARVTITGRQDSSISFEMKGEALSSFETRRIGLCVHHPIATCKGKKVIITKPDFSTYSDVYPEHISPHQPFKNIHEMAWNTDQNDSIHLKFEGDVFETEDQRNWNDNAYKTYGTPLDLPAPVLITKGATMGQRIGLSIKKNPTPITRTGGFNAGPKEEKVAFPKIGYSRIAGTGPLTEMEITALKNIPFDHYRVELSMKAFDWQNELSTAFSDAENTGTELELVVFFTSAFESEIAQLLMLPGEHKNKIKRLLPLHVESNVTSPLLLQQVYSRFKEIIPGIEIGYGTNASFAELNRNRPVDTAFDFVCFSMNPQVHATDTRSIIENLESQEETITTIRQFTSKPIHVSPVTFQKRNVSLTDPRLQTHFGAAWTLMSLRNLCRVASITFYQTTGEMGVIGTPGSIRNNVSKIYEVMAQLKKIEPLYVIIDEKSQCITFENSFGDRLKYLVDEIFWLYRLP